MKQYLDLAKRIIEKGEWQYNERTKKWCKVVINADLVYDVDQGKFPLLTTRKSFWKSAIAEMLAYLRGYDNAADFRALGTKTWDANANDNEAWLNNPFRKGKDDMGRVYGVQGREWTNSRGQKIDQLQKVVDHLMKGIDDRGETITFWNPGEFDMGCLRPCMHTHTFSILNDRLYLTSYQRSCDVPLGLAFNMPQVYFLLLLMSYITGIPAGKAYHKIINAHIYEDQIDLMKEQIEREPYESPYLFINRDLPGGIKGLLEATPSDFTLLGYKHHDPIKYPFSV